MKTETQMHASAIYAELFHIINNYMLENKLSITELAKRMGIGRYYIERLLNGENDIKLSKLVEISLFFGKKPVFTFVDKAMVEHEKTK